MDASPLGRFLVGLTETRRLLEKSGKSALFPVLPLLYECDKDFSVKETTSGILEVH